MQVGINC